RRPGRGRPGPGRYAARAGRAIPWRPPVPTPWPPRGGSEGRQTVRRSPCFLRCVSSRIAVVLWSPRRRPGEDSTAWALRSSRRRTLQLTMDQLSGLGTGDAPRDRVVLTARLRDRGQLVAWWSGRGTTSSGTGILRTVVAILLNTSRNAGGHTTDRVVGLPLP